MPRSSNKKEPGAPNPNDAPGSQPENLPRGNTPTEVSILKSPKGKVYRVIRTNEMDSYDEKSPEEESVG